MKSKMMVPEAGGRGQAEDKELLVKGQQVSDRQEGQILRSIAEQDNYNQ